MIPPGGSDADTLFTAAQIDDLLFRYGTTERGLRQAAAEGWDLKAAIYANLVNTTTGVSTRNMSDLYKNAQAQADKFRKQAASGNGDGTSATTIGKIKRAGSTIR